MALLSALAGTAALSSWVKADSATSELTPGHIFPAVPGAVCSGPEPRSLLHRSRGGGRGAPGVSWNYVKISSSSRSVNVTLTNGSVCKGEEERNPVKQKKIRKLLKFWLKKVHTSQAFPLGPQN